MSRRTERLGNLIRAIVSEAIRDRLNDPRIETLTSITRVEVSADLSVARVNVSVLAAEARRKLCVQALQHAAGRLRAAVAEQVHLRQVPRLEFHLDDSVRQAFDTVQVIDAAMAELGQPPPWESPEAGAGDAGAPEDGAAEPGNGAQPDRQEGD